jgi:hypothetical protein
MDFICSTLNTKATSDLSTVPDFVLATQLTRNWYTDYRFSPALVRLFSATVEKARAQGVEVVLVMAPMSQYELEFLRQSGQWPKFQEFKRMITGYGPFWDFTGYNAIARTDQMFRDGPADRARKGLAALQCRHRSDRGQRRTHPAGFARVGTRRAGSEASGSRRSGVTIFQDGDADTQFDRGQECALGGPVKSD